MGNIIKYTAIIIVGLIIVWVVGYAVKVGPKNVFQGPSVQEETGEVLSVEEVSDKVMSFLNNNVLRGQVTASLIETVKENGLYKIKFKIEGQDREIESYATLDGKLFFPEVIELTEVEPVAVESGTTIGGFKISNDEICQENDKPIVYFFGSERCGFCKWEHPIVEAVAQKFEGEISFHNNMDTDDDEDIFKKYSTGGIPTMIFGCKYYKTGAGTANGEEGEAKNLTALICKLTGNKPNSVCKEVQDLINQI